MSLRSVFLLIVLLSFFVHLVSVRETLYQNAGYVLLNQARAEGHVEPNGLSSMYSLAEYFFDKAFDLAETNRSIRGLGFAWLYQNQEELALQVWNMRPVAMQEELQAHGDKAVMMAQYNTAVYWYEKALSLDSKQERCALLYRLGKAYELVGDLDSAQQQFLRCVESGEPYIDAYVALCFSYVNKGGLEEAVTLWTSLDRTVRQDSSLLTCIGVGYMDANEYEQALIYFRDAVAIDPERASLYQWLSLAYTRAGMLLEAIDSAERATTLDSHRIEYWQHLANLYRETGQDGAATAILQKITVLERAQRSGP